MRFPNRPNRPPLISRRELWRLGMLVVALALVAAMMGELRQPKTAARLERMLDGGKIPAVSPEPLLPTAANAGSNDGEFTIAAVAGASDGAAASTSKAIEQEADASNGEFRELLALAGWKAERLEKLGDGKPLSDEQRKELLDLLRRLKTFDATQLNQWAASHVSLSQLADQPSEYRGRLFMLAGRVRHVRRRTLPPDLAARLELPAYVECQLATDDGKGLAKIVTARVPNAWSEMVPLDEPAAAVGVFVKVLPSDGESAVLLISPSVAWYPREVREPYVSFGQSLLGMLEMDVGLLDTIEQRRSIRATEREAFYQMLAAASRAGANQLIRFATSRLKSVGQTWADEVERLRALAGNSPEAARAEDRQRLALAQEVERRAGEGRYSVAPLFNEPASQVGQLVALEGVARRAVRIDVGAANDGAASDVVHRFGIDHYFEMDVFTDDSQNNPVVFCVCELPPGFPTGEAIREPVRVAGFFFKSWSFRSRRPANAGDDGGKPLAARQFAPLLVGRGPIWIQTPPADGGNRAGWIIGGSFALLLAAIWAAIWWFGGRRRTMHERILPERLSLPEGPLHDNLASPSESGFPELFPQSPAETGDEGRLQ